MFPPCACHTRSARASCCCIPCPCWLPRCSSLLAISNELKTFIFYLLPHNSPPSWRFLKSELNIMNQLISAHLTSCVTYVPMPNGIKSHIVHPNELHRAQPAKTKSATAISTSWIIWTSLPIPSWRTTSVNLSLSGSLIWDSRFFTHFSGFNLVPFAANNSTIQYSSRLHDLHPVSHPVRS